MRAHMLRCLASAILVLHAALGMEFQMVPTNHPLPSIPGDLPAAQVPNVYISLFMQQIQEIDGISGKWTAELVVNHKFHAADFPGGIAEEPHVEIPNGKLLWANERNRRIEGGVVRVTRRFFVELVFNGDYSLFPFDTQQLIVHADITGKDYNMVRLVEDTDVTSGVHPTDERTGRHFKAAQFRLKGWNIGVEKQLSFGVPYAKSRATMTLLMERFLPYYTLTCIVLPAMTVLFSFGAFHLPVAPLMPRVMISFISFLTTFVHLKQVMSLVPKGSWCWLFSELCFMLTILSATILMNIVSAVVSIDCADLAKRHDSLLRFMLPAQWVLGWILLFSFKAWHVEIFSIYSSMVFVYNTLAAYFTLVEARQGRAAEPGSCAYYFLLEYLPCFKDDDESEPEEQTGRKRSGSFAQLLAEADAGGDDMASAV